jgi:hypothetical protein
MDRSRSREPRHPSLAQCCGALVEAGRVDTLRPPGVFNPQVVVKLQQRPPLQHLRRRDIALRHPPRSQQLTKELRISLVFSELKMIKDSRLRASPGCVEDRRDHSVDVVVVESS